MQSIQLISRIDNNKWWKNLFIHYASKGKSFEIRCWDEEIESIELISKFGTVKKSKTTKEIIITGDITNKFIDLIVKEEKDGTGFYYGNVINGVLGLSEMVENDFDYGII